MKFCSIDVKFGDFLILRENNTSLIIDFGSKNSVINRYYDFNKLVHIVYNKINKMEHVEALLTHFHDDHYKGFKQLGNFNKKLFNKFYLPNIYFQLNSKYVLLEYCVYAFLTFNSTTNAYESTLDILKHVVTVYNLTHNPEKNIRYLMRDDEFIYESKKFLVLWPDIFQDYSQFNDINRMNDDIQLMLSALNRTNDRYNIEIEELKTNIIDNMIHWKTLLDQGHESVKNEIDNVVKKQTRFIRQLFRIKNSLDREKIMDWLKQKDTSFFNKSSTNFSRIKNRMSIVFHNKLPEFNHNILLTGDTDKDVIDLLTRDFHEDYQLIKVQHHGTCTHYSSNLPKAKNYIISSGEFNSYKKITDKYKNKDLHVHMYCTSGGQYCEIRDIKQKCINSSCLNVIKSIKL